MLLEVLRVDSNVREIISQHFTNRIRVSLFVPCYSGHPTFQTVVEVSCFELLNSFVGCDPESLDSDVDPTEYALSDIVLIAIDVTFSRIRLELLGKHGDEYQLHIRKHRFELAITELSGFNLITLHWNCLLPRRGKTPKFKRRVSSNTPITLEHKYKEFDLLSTTDSQLVLRNWVLSPVQEILHSGAFIETGHFTSRSPSLSPLRIIYSDGDKVKEIKFYTSNEIRHRWQISSIAISATELPTHRNNYQHIQAYGFRSVSMNSLNDAEAFTKYRIPYHIEYFNEPVKYPIRIRVNVCAILIDFHSVHH